MKDLFDITAERYDSIVPFFTVFAQRMVEWAEPGPGEKILDIATGRGAVLRQALVRVGQTGTIIGIDISPNVLERLAADLRHGTNTRLMVMDACQLDLPDASFDKVLCGFAMHLLPDPKQGLAEAYRVLKPGGALAFSLPGPVSDRWRFYHELIGEFAPLVDKAKWPDFGMPDPERLMQEAGFASIHRITAEIQLPVADADTFWESEMSHGMRGYLTALPAAARRAFREQLTSYLEDMQREGGIVLDRSAYFFKGTRPA